MKRLMTKVASVIGVTILGLGMSAGAIAQQSAPVDVSIDNDPNAALTGQIVESSPFETLTYSNSDQTTTGALTVMVTDTRGTAEGWTLYLSGGGDFTGTGTGQTIPLGNLSLAGGSVVVLAGQASPAPGGSSVTSVTTAPQPMLSAEAGSGSGSYSMSSTASLLVPGGTLVDNYRTSLTVGFSAAP